MARRKVGRGGRREEGFLLTEKGGGVSRNITNRVGPGDGLAHDDDADSLL